MAKRATKGRARKPAAKKQAERQSRWITVHSPFNFYWPSRAVTHFHTPGEYCVKSEVADFAVERGYATEGKQEGSDAGTSADTGSATIVGDPNAADADRPADRPPVDNDAG